LSEDVPVDGRASDIEVALAAASAGAAVVRAAYGAEITRHAKRGHDFATDADLDAERTILGIIAGARPHDACVGEETGRSGGSSTRRWLVDSLCGTLNFAAQTPLIAVNVALLAGSSYQACVSADPIAEELFWTDGKGAFRRYDGIDEPLRPTADSRLVDVNCDGPTDGHLIGPQLVADATFREAFSPRVTSTTLAVAWVAAGRRAAYVSDGLFIDNVHFAAGIGLCVGAGCRVTDLAGQAVGVGHGLLVATDAQTHTRLIEIIRPHLEDLLAHP
jgi:myo-inositol-1(or 4)-monophosphatase